MTIDTLKLALTKYIEDEFVKKLPDWRKWAFGVGAGVLISKLDVYYNKYYDLLTQLEVANEDRTLNVENAYAMLFEVAEKQGDIVQNIPLIGEVKFKKEDITNLYNIIKSMGG